MSFREWLEMEKGIKLSQLSLEQIIENEISFPYTDFRPLPLFKEYLNRGYYPFYKDINYNERLIAVIEQTLEVDIPQFAGLSVGVMRKLKQLMQIIAQISPFKPNYSDLARDISVNRSDLKDYLFYMEKSGMIQSLVSSEKGLNLLSKVEKIYLDNTNLMTALSNEATNIGNIETFFFNQLKVKNQVTLSPVSDFLVNNKYTFEIGGRKKGKKQIKDIDNSYIVKDDIEYAYSNVIPLWAFGLNY